MKLLKSARQKSYPSVNRDKNGISFLIYKRKKVPRRRCQAKKFLFI